MVSNYSNLKVLAYDDPNIKGQFAIVCILNM